MSAKIDPVSKIGLWMSFALIGVFASAGGSFIWVLSSNSFKYSEISDFFWCSLLLFMGIGVKQSSALFGVFVLTFGGSLQTAILICLLKSSRYSGISDFVRGFLAIGLFMAPEKLVAMAKKLVSGILRLGHCL